MWEPNILTDIHEPLLNKINSPEEGRTAESLYRRRKNTEDNRKTEIVVQRKIRIVLTPTTIAQIKNIAKFSCFIFIAMEESSVCYFEE